MSDGTWMSDFNPENAAGESGFIEGNAWQYTWFIPQNIEGLVNFLGGKAAFTQKLDTFFTKTWTVKQGAYRGMTGLIGMHAQGNEPTHHTPYLYDYGTKPWKTQQLVRYIMDSLYTSRPDGIAGNEDCGQMSAWYVFSALGFYPVNPCSQTYDIGSPAMEKAVIQVNDGNTFTITAKNFSEKNVYIRSVTLNGQPLKKPFIRHEDIINGGELEFEMGDRPNKQLFAE